MKEDKWNKYYKSAGTVLKYPDENLVRMVKSFLAGSRKNDIIRIKTIDIGCGTGRHMNMLGDLGIMDIQGADTSFDALFKCHELYKFPVILADNSLLPFKNNVFDIIIAWGSLHYCEKEETKMQLKEIHRIIKEDGGFFGTLRSGNDTYLKKGKEIAGGTWLTDNDDLQNSVVSFFNEDELRSLLGIFGKYKYGLMERTVLGDLSQTISHWFFYAVK